MCKFHNWCGFLFGAFMIVFTFVSWTATRWIIFAIGIILVFHALFGRMCWCNKECKTPIAKAVSKPKKKRR